MQHFPEQREDNMINYSFPQFPTLIVFTQLEGFSGRVNQPNFSLSIHIKPQILHIIPHISSIYLLLGYPSPKFESLLKIFLKLSETVKFVSD